MRMPGVTRVVTIVVTEIMDVMMIVDRGGSHQNRDRLEMVVMNVFDVGHPEKFLLDPRYYFLYQKIQNRNYD